MLPAWRSTTHCRFRRWTGRDGRQGAPSRGGASASSRSLLLRSPPWQQRRSGCTRPAPPSVVRTMVTTSGSAALSLEGADDRDVAITPDGSRVVYRGNNQLLVRALDELEPTVLSGLGAPRGLFISPDGQWIGFFDGTTIKKVAITGGPPVTVCARQGKPRGATWSDDGTIIFATDAPATGLQRVSATGGEPTVLTTPDRERGEGDHVLARVPAWRQRGSLHDYSGHRCHRERADCGAGSADRHVEGAHPWRQPRALRADGASCLRRHRDVTRRGVRPRTAGGGRDACASARGRGDDRHRAPLTSRWPPTVRSSTSQAGPAVASRPSSRWIARDVSHRCRASRRTRTAISGCRPTGRGSHSPRRTMCGSTILRAQR